MNDRSNVIKEDMHDIITYQLMLKHQEKNVSAELCFCAHITLLEFKKWINLIFFNFNVLGFFTWYH